MHTCLGRIKFCIITHLEPNGKVFQILSYKKLRDEMGLRKISGQENIKVQMD